MTSDKTQILSADDLRSGGTTDREPRFDGERIVFFCPNGHKITVDRGLAGKPGMCNGYRNEGCGVRFVVPSPPGFGKPGATPDSTAVTSGVEFDFGVGAASVATSGPTMVESPAGIPASPVVPERALILDPPVVVESLGASAGAADASGVGKAGTEPLDLDRIDHPAARLVARLWQERAHGGVVEVHLSGGSVIMPQWYDPWWSMGDHAVFAAEAADGTLTLTAVAWNQVQKVVVRQVDGQPDGMFEG